MPAFLASGIILRTALIKKMREKSTKKNIFITAPGGYGKTLAANQWLDSTRGTVVRMISGQADNDPGVFYRRLAMALLRLTGKSKYAPAYNMNLALDGLLEMLSILPKKSPRCHLLVDDLHLIKNEEILDSIPLIISRLPGYVCLCLVSRAAPLDSLLQTKGFEVFTKADLLFTPEEIECLCDEKECTYTPEQIKDLYQTTGGWAMYLSALLSNKELPKTESKGKPPQTLLQYLDTHVWGPWSLETKDLLMRLAVPDEVTDELCRLLTGCEDGCQVLEKLVKKETAFLSPTSDGTYRFHDIFLDFLRKCADKYLDENEMYELNRSCAVWYYEKGDYYPGARHYIRNKDHDGINHCMLALNRFHEEAGGMSVEVKLNFIKQYILNLTPEFIGQNPYLISKCVVMAFHDGDAEGFKRYTDMLHKKLSEISAGQTDVAGNYGFASSLDFRVSLKDCAKKVAEMMPLIQATSTRAEAQVSNITQNLPYFHRSMRDYSEYYDLNEEELQMVRDTFGVMIGKDYDVMEQAIYTGLLYERGEMLEALRHGLSGFYLCQDEMQPETVFCAYIILSAVLYALGASREAAKIMGQTENFIERKSQFLRPNFKALQTERKIRAGDTDSAKEWLTVYANRSEWLPFYQINRHFTTLRSYIAVMEYAAAIAFGKRLHRLAVEYNRPLDQIESLLLTAIALWRNAEKDKGVQRMVQAISLAIPYGFIQLFINEGNEILDLLWALRESEKNAVEILHFIDKLTSEICAVHGLQSENVPEPNISPQQRAMLIYLHKGMTYNEIATKLGLTRGTVKSHVLLLYKRLGVHTAQEAVVKAKMLGLLG